MGRGSSKLYHPVENPQTLKHFQDLELKYIFHDKLSDIINELFNMDNNEK